jgi:hypothetical protein
MHVHNSTGNDGAYTVASVNWSDPDFIITVEETIPSAVADGTIGDFIIVINDPSTALRKSINLNDITVAADSSTLNNRWFNIVVWGVRNKSGELSYLMCNLPSSNSYLSEANAIDDASNETIYTIPDDYNGVGFLIARFTIRKSGASFTYNGGSAFTELRGQFPSTAAGGGGGGGGGGTMSSFTITADSGTPETIVDGDAIDIAGGNGISTTVAATDTVTVNAAPTTQAGLPGSAPTFVGEVDADTTNDRTFIAADTSANTDWKRADAGKVKLAEASATSDVASLSISSFVADNRTFRMYELVIVGLESDRAAVVTDNLLIQVNGDTTAANYNVMTVGFRVGLTTAQETLGTVAGFRLIQAISAAGATTSGIFGNTNVFFYNPENTGDKKHMQWQGGIATETATQGYVNFGTGHWETTGSAITSFTILPEFGTTFLIDPATAAEPDELRIELYGWY